MILVVNDKALEEDKETAADANFQTFLLCCLATTKLCLSFCFSDLRRYLFCH